MTTSAYQFVRNQTASDPALSLAERISALLQAIDGPIQAPIFFTRRKILKRLNLEPTLEQRELVTKSLPQLRSMRWRARRFGFLETGEEILEFQRQR